MENVMSTTQNAETTQLAIDYRQLYDELADKILLDSDTVICDALQVDKQQQIKRAIKDLEQELAVLRAADAILERRLAGNWGGSITPEQLVAQARKPLNDLCIEAITQADDGLRPMDVIRYCATMGHTFKNRSSASATVGTALKRLVTRGRVVNRDGRYFLARGS
jgi:multidrug efflux pump subunit AcrA (membrane-fusion protein)